MKREIKAPADTKPINAPKSSKTDEREFGEAIKSMIESMSKSWRRQVIAGLDTSTIDKFADAQIGNYAKIMLTLSKRVNRKLVKRFDDKSIDKLSNKFTGRSDKRNKKDLYSAIEKRIGISRKELEATEGLMSQINAMKLETSQWIKKIRDETLQDWTANTLRMMADGQDLPSILAGFDGMVEKRKGHAEMVARTQIASFNSLTTKARAQNLGIEKARWVTSHDERVRKSHRSRNGKEFDLAEGLYSSADGKTLLPGTDYNCRCDYELIIPEMSE